MFRNFAVAQLDGLTSILFVLDNGAFDISSLDNALVVYSRYTVYFVYELIVIGPPFVQKRSTNL